MSIAARFGRIIHQQAQVLSLETFYSNPESQTNCAAVKIYSTTAFISMVFTKLLLVNALAIRPCNYEAAPEPFFAQSFPFAYQLSHCAIWKVHHPCFEALWSGHTLSLKIVHYFLMLFQIQFKNSFLSSLLCHFFNFKTNVSNTLTCTIAALFSSEW